MKLLPPKYRIKFYQKGRTGYYKIQKRHFFFFYFDEKSIWSDYKNVYSGYRFSSPPESLLQILLKYG